MNRRMLTALLLLATVVGLARGLAVNSHSLSRRGWPAAGASQSGGPGIEPTAAVPSSAATERPVFSPAAPPAPVVDVRSPDAFARGHVAGAAHVPLPDLERRSFELPAPFEVPSWAARPRHRPLSLSLRRLARTAAIFIFTAASVCLALVQCGLRLCADSAEQLACAASVLETKGWSIEVRYRGGFAPLSPT